MKNVLHRILPVGLATAAVLALMLPQAQAAPTKYLTIGDHAPALASAKWLKGNPVPQFQPGKFYVVEFWATWCGPCKQNIPHLTELAKKYKNQVDIIGVDIWERQKPVAGDYVKYVAKFVTKQGKTMDYHVAVDDPKDQISKTWMDRAGEKGIPCSFIVDKNGKVAWIGHPAAMEPVLKQVLAGTYNSVAARDKRELEMQLLRPIDDAMAAKDYSAAVTNIETALAKKPELRYALGYPYLVALFHTDPVKGDAYIKNILADAKGEIGAYQMISAVFASEDDLSKAAYESGIRTIDEALKLWPREYMFKVMKADVLFHNGQTQDALTLGKEALTEAQGAPYRSAQAITLIKKNIAKYEQAKG